MTTDKPSFQFTQEPITVPMEVLQKAFLLITEYRDMLDHNPVCPRGKRKQCFTENEDGSRTDNCVRQRNVTSVLKMLEDALKLAPANPVQP